MRLSTLKQAGLYGGTNSLTTPLDLITVLQCPAVVRTGIKYFAAYKWN